MPRDFMTEASPIIKDFLMYIQVVLNRSVNTVDEYYSDIRLFFRFLKKKRNLVSADTQLNQISIDDVDIYLIQSVTINDALEFMTYLERERHNGAHTRMRKASSLKSFFNYLTTKKHLLSYDPMKELDRAKAKKSLPKYLTLEQSVELLNAVEGEFKERDYCILTIFLNCGLRLSELCGLNFNDIRSDNTMRVKGKGNKERILYLNQACVDALNEYKKVRPVDVKDRQALFISRQNNRISQKTVQAMVYKYLAKIGLDSQGYSCHKLRHTAATLMYQHGNVDVRVLQEVLGHENLGTTQIYTHTSSQQKKDAIESNPLSNIKPKKDDKKE